MRDGGGFHQKKMGSVSKRRGGSGVRPKLRVHRDQRLWMDDGVHRLSRMLGSRRMLNVWIILATDESPRDPYDKRLQIFTISTESKKRGIARALRPEG